MGRMIPPAAFPQFATQSVRRLVAALLLLVAAAHATLPVGRPLELGSGSAFSAATAEVALGCAARVTVERQALPDHSAPPAAICGAAPTPFAATVRATAPVHAYEAQAPPRFLALFPQSSPRAPPAA